jgi:hypothetical protein
VTLFLDVSVTVFLRETPEKLRGAHVSVLCGWESSDGAGEDKMVEGG